MKAHIGVNAQSGLVHTVVGTAANVNDLTQAGALLHGEEQAASGDAGYQGVHKRPEAAGPLWQVAVRPGLRRQLNRFIEPMFLPSSSSKSRPASKPRSSIPSGSSSSSSATPRFSTAGWPRTPRG